MKTDRLPATPLEILQHLVRTPSVNPDGADAAESSGEAAVADLLGGWLAGLGADVRLEEVLPARPNVIGVFPSDRPGKPVLLLAPHTDTVGVGGMTVEPFGGDLRDGRIYGRGACDTKGCIAAMLAALVEIGAERLATASHEIWFVGLMGEETGQKGARDFVSRHRPAFALIGEPTGLQVVFRHKGGCRLRLTAPGVAAHSSRPDLGVNAIYRMLEVIAWLRGEVEPSLAQWPDPVLGSPTMSLGILHGGTRANIVPETCEASVDFRTVPAQAAAGFVASLQRGLEEKFPWLGVQIVDAPPLNTDPAHPLVSALGGLGNGLTGQPWFCDAAWFSHAGIPAVAAGPGEMKFAHTAAENIAVVDLEAGVRFYRDFLLGL